MSNEQKPVPTKDYSVAAATQGKADPPKGLPPSTPDAAKAKGDAKPAAKAPTAAEKRAAKEAQVKLGTGMQKIGSRIAGYFQTDHKQVADAKPTGPMQYRLMAVPSPDTKLNLGEWVKNPGIADIGAAFGYPGFSVGTAANHFSNVGGTTVFQGTGDVTQQGGAKWTQFSQQWDASALKRISVTSGEAIMIGAGTTTLPSEFVKGIMIPTSGAALKPPVFDHSKLHDQILDHTSDSLNFVLKSTVSLSKSRRDLGLPMLPVPEVTIWQLLGLALHKAANKIQELKGKVGKIEAKLKEAEAKAKKANEWLKKNSDKVEASIDSFWSNMSTAAPWTGMMLNAAESARGVMDGALGLGAGGLPGGADLLAAFPSAAMPDVAGALGGGALAGLPDVLPGELPSLDDVLARPVGLGVDQIPGTSLIEQAQDAASRARSAAGGALDTARGMAQSAASTAQGVAGQAMGAVNEARSMAQGVVNQAQGVASGVASAARGAVNQVTSAAQSVSNAAQGAVNQVTSAASGVANAAQGAVSGVTNAAKGVGDAVSSAAQGVTRAAAGGIGGLPSTVASAVGGVTNVAGAAQNAVGAAQNAVGGAVGAAQNAVGGAVGAAQNAVGGAVGAAQNAVGAAQNAVGGAVGAARGAAGAVTGAASKVTGAMDSALKSAGGGGPASGLLGAVANKLGSPAYAPKIGKAMKDVTDAANKHFLSKQSATDAKGDPSERKIKELDWQKDGQQFITTTNQMLDEGERFVATCKEEYAKAQPHMDKLAELAQKAKDAKLDADGDGHVSMKEALAAMQGLTAGAAEALGALQGLCKMVSKMLNALAAALDNVAMNLLAGAGSGKLFLSAADNVEVGSSKKIHLYAAAGVDLDTDKGGFRAQTAKEIAFRTQDMGEFLSEKHLWLEGLKGAELTSKGPTVLASRQATAEVLGKTVRVGALESAATGRKKNDGDLGGGFAEAKQHATDLLHTLATDKTVLQVAGKSPDGDKPTLAQDTPFYLSADKDGKVEVHAKDGGHIRLQIGKYVLQLKDKEISLGLAGSATEDPKAKLIIHEDGNILLDTGHLIALENKGNRLGLNESDGAWLIPGSSTKLEMAKSGVKIKGTKINIG